MLYILGILTGISLSIIVILSTKRYQIPIERTLKQIDNITKEKGEVFVDSDQDEELKHFLNSLPKEL